MLTSLLPLILAQAAAAQAAGHAAPSPQSPSAIVAAAPAAEWIAIPPEELLVMDIAPTPDATPRRIVIQLMPAPFSAAWVGNVRTLAKAQWWDGTSVNRVQDNYVVQWGDASEKKPLPPGLATPSEGDYTLAKTSLSDRIVAGPRDAYAARTGFWRGWPLGMEGERVWPVHCYGMVGVGRDVSPSTGTGAELYTVIGHAPRHLDRNIALVGRVVEGIEFLSSLPRGSLALGFYSSAAQRVPIVSVRLVSTLPATQQPRFAYLSTGGTAWNNYAGARANRKDDFFIRPAGAVDVCNLPVPVRRIDGGS